MLIALLALAAAPSTFEAETYLRRLNTRPLWVTFRNVRQADEIVCGEVRWPGDTQFYKFAYQSPLYVVAGYAHGPGGALGGLYEGSDFYQRRIRSAESQGDYAEANADRVRQARFEEAARQFLAHCE